MKITEHSVILCSRHAKLNSVSIDYSPKYYVNKKLLMSWNQWTKESVNRMRLNSHDIFVTVY